ADEFPAKSKWQVLKEIKNAFVTEKGKKPVTLVYIDHEYDLSASDIEVAVPIMPTQIRDYFFRNFLRCGHEMYTRYPDKSNSVIGEIRIPLEESRDIMERTITPLLEERFDVSLTKKERLMA
ncbi:MAG TPA: hypothetical protein VJ110_00775, partial [Candidatus Nanoarchaeia archaeon]|nr:hypothetical protein [Candidatus Nanoarchaeia archaeon]